MASNDTGQQRHRAGGGSEEEAPGASNGWPELPPGASWPEPGQLVLILAAGNSFLVWPEIWWPDNHYQTTVLCSPYTPIYNHLKLLQPHLWLPQTPTYHIVNLTNCEA